MLVAISVRCFRAEDLSWFDEKSFPLLYLDVKRNLERGYFCEPCIDELMYTKDTHEEQWEKYSDTIQSCYIRSSVRFNGEE